MLRVSRFVVVLSVLPLALWGQSDGPVTRSYRARADRIIDAALADSGAAWNTLAQFTDYSGNRLSGSASLEPRRNCAQRAPHATLAHWLPLDG